MLQLLFHTNWLAFSTKSFWAGFDSMTVYLKPIYYDYITALCLLSAAGLCRKALQMAKHGIKAFFGAPFVTALFFACVVVFALSVYYSSSCDYQPQGRYFFPALIPGYAAAYDGL